MSWKLYGDWAFYAAAVVAVSFALLYLTIAPWWETATGRNVMAVMGSFAAAFAYFAWAIANNGIPRGFYPVRALLFTGIALAIGWRIWMLIRVQLLHRHSKPKEGNDEMEDARQVNRNAAGDDRHGGAR